MTDWHARLEGGPMDGDDAQIGEPDRPTPAVWVIPCPERDPDRCAWVAVAREHAPYMVAVVRRDCPTGSHWMTVDPCELAVGDVHRYRFDRTDDDGTSVYVYGELTVERGIDVGEAVAA